MKNFDEAREARIGRDRSFQIGGEPFVLRSGIRPEALEEYETMTSDTRGGEALRIIDDLIISMIEPDGDAEARWLNLRKQDEDPITMEDMGELVDWMISEMTGRPTTAPSPSPGGRASTVDSSTDGARLAVAT